MLKSAICMYCTYRSRGWCAAQLVKRNLFVTAAVLSVILPPATPKLHIIYNLSLLFENLPCLEVEESPKAEHQSSEVSRPQSANVNNMSCTYIKSSKPKNETANMHSYVVPSQKYISTIIIYYLVFCNSKFYSLINYILNSWSEKYMIGELYC